MESLDRQGIFSALLSHHPVDQWHLCYRFSLGGRDFAVCARCLGIIPVMLVTFAVGALTGPWPGWFQWMILLFPPLPALLEWGTAAVAGKPERKNWIRMTTGIGMGIGIGAALHINSTSLLNTPICVQFLYIVSVVLVVRFVAYLKNSPQRRALRQRLQHRPTLEEFIRASGCSGKETSRIPSNQSVRREPPITG